MIRWCLYLKHQSSKVYQTLRNSGCIVLPSERTPRNYSHCVKATAGFLIEVDRQLSQAAKLTSYPEWHKFVILLLDEIHIKEQLVFNKYMGQTIGFTDLGDVNNQLIA